jgi:NAD(P)H-flavin reductase
MGGSEISETLAITARSYAGGGLSLVRFAGASATRVLATYRLPGQYVTVASLSADAPPSYFVLASPVGADAVEIVLRGGDEVADRLTTGPLGTRVTMSAAQGAGFPSDRAAGRPLWVAVAGSGVAAARAIAAFRRASGEPDVRSTRLFVGVRRLAELPLRAELEDLARAGMAVTICTSREQPAAPEANGLRLAPGYVQAALALDLERPSPDARLFAAGPDAMVVALRELARARGEDPRDVHTNY